MLSHEEDAKNIGASVRARLLRLSTERREDFQLLLTRYANERLLYRLAQSQHGAQFVLKGAALFTLWTGRAHRATRDLDLLGFGDATEARVRAVFQDVIGLDVPDDGVVFEVASLDVGPIREDQEYGGVRVALVATVTSARVRLQIDVGFGDPALTAAVESAAAAAGAVVRSAAGEGNGSTPADEFMRGAIDSASRYERALIRARTTAALAVIRARGQKTGGSVPYGYRLDADGRTLVAVEGEQATIARTRALAVEGRSQRAIAAQLAAKGHVSRKGVPFFAAQVGRMVARVEAQRAA